MYTTSASLARQFAPYQIARGSLWIATSESSDADLIEGIAAGDRAAMQVLFARHSVRVYRFSLRLICDEAIAEEVVSDVFLEVWRKAGVFESRSQVTTWLLGITRHKAIAMLRRRPTETLDDRAVESIVDTADDPETGLRREQQSSIFINCLANLSPDHREIIDLVYYHHKTIDEIAAIMRVPRNAVKSRMFYARQKLAELLGVGGIATALA
jgi:RNA polymerase sigma-70 factor (ECF subfamily)